MKDFLAESGVKSRITRKGVLKLIADAILINISIITSLVVRLLWIIAYAPQANIDYKQTLWNYWSVYSDSAWLLTLICLVIFSINGFYTQGRLYRGRYKPLVIIQAVSLAYLVFGALTYLSQGIFFDFLKGLPDYAPRRSDGLLGAEHCFTGCGAYLELDLETAAREVEGTQKPVEQPKPRRALVIGGAGYIGSALVPLLLERGLPGARSGSADLWRRTDPSWLDDPRLEVIQADFRQIDRVVSAMQDVDAVIHLGAIVGDPACALDEGLTTEINLMATRVIAEVAKGYGVRYFIFASTCSVYGASDQVLDEHAPIKPILALRAQQGGL